MILAGEGPAFCAGHDLGEMRGLDEAGYRAVFELCSELMMAIHELPAAGDRARARHRDRGRLPARRRLRSRDRGAEARFATPGVKIGLFCSTPMVAVARAVGRKRALEMLLTGDADRRATAADWGLVNRVVPPDELAEATARSPRASPREPADARHRQAGLLPPARPALPEAYELRAAEVMAATRWPPTPRRACRAFLEKREPVWTG